MSKVGCLHKLTVLLSRTPANNAFHGHFHNVECYFFLLVISHFLHETFQSAQSVWISSSSELQVIRFVLREDFFVVVVFLEPHPWHTEFPRLSV